MQKNDQNNNNKSIHVKHTYQQMKTKDDTLYLRHARKVLGQSNFDYIYDLAMERYDQFDNENVAKREANLVILKYLTEIGAQHWRHPEEDHPIQEPQIDRHISADIDIKPPISKRERKHWTGMSILDMAQDSINKRKAKHKS